MTALVDSARTFIGVRFKHRGRDRLGLDCAGLCWAAYDSLGLRLPDFRLYGTEPHRDGLTRHAAAALGEPVVVAPVQLAALRPGDVIVMRYRREPHHMGVVGEKRYGDTEALTLIHAEGVPGKGEVHEQRLTPDMVARITHVFRKPV